MSLFWRQKQSYNGNMLDILAHLFTPHHSNNHRARALHPQAFVFYILFMFVLQISLKTLSTTFPNILGYATDISVQRLLELTNQKRQDAGLSTLTLSPALSQAAANKAADMFTKNYWAHISPDGKTPWEFITQSGYKYVYAGENLAKNFNDSSGVVTAWMNSPSHRDNILKKEYKDVGFAVVNGHLNGEETTLVVQEFGATSTNPIAKAETEAVIEVIPSNIPYPTVSKAPVLLVVISPTIPVSPTAAAPNTVEIAGSQNANSARDLIADAKFLPLFNVTRISRVISLGLVAFLLALLAIDSLFIWKRKTVRVGGHNFAHLLFLVSLVGVIYLTGSGAIM